MPLRVICPQCGCSLYAPESAIGKMSRCPRCQQTIKLAAAVDHVAQPAPPVDVIPVNLPIAQPLARVMPPELPLATAGADRRQMEPTVVYRPCPFCAEDVRIEAKRCKHCGETLDAAMRKAEESERRAVDAARSSRRGGGNVVVYNEVNAQAHASAVAVSGSGRTIWSTCLGLVLLSMLCCGGCFWIGSFAKHAEPTAPIRAAGNVPPLGPDWTDASKSTIVRDNVEVGITGVSRELVALDDLGQIKSSKEKQLVIRLFLENKSNVKRVDYVGWQRPGDIGLKAFPVLKDSFGNIIRRVDWGLLIKPVGQKVNVSIKPGQRIEDVLVFDIASADIDWLDLELPATAFGGSGKLLFQIPGSMVK